MKSKFYYKNKNAPKPNLPPVIGCVAIIIENKKYLLEHRSDSNRWAFIGGMLESNEDFVDCVIRETFEETGLNIVSSVLYETFSDPSIIIEYPDGNSRRIITMAFMVKVEKFEKLICSPESTELKFFSREELLQIKIAETHKPILDSL